MEHCPIGMAGSASVGPGNQIHIRATGWPSYGRRTAAPLFPSRAVLATAPASFPNFCRMSSVGQLSLNLLKVGSDADWRFLPIGSAARLWVCTDAFDNGSLMLLAMAMLRLGCDAKTQALLFAPSSADLKSAGTTLASGHGEH